MTLPSGADVKIGPYEFVLDREGDQPGFRIHSYEHTRQSLYSSQQQIEGSQGKNIANPNFLLWRTHDWSGGDGLKYFDPNNPNQYWTGTGNGRIAGTIQGPPNVTGSAGSLTISTAYDNIIMLKAAGFQWLISSREAFYTSDGSTWIPHSQNPLFGSGFQITAAIGIRDKVWLSAWDGSTRKVKQLDPSVLSTAVNDVTGDYFLGMAENGGFIYGWTGRSLLRYDPQVTLPIDQDATMKVYTPYSDAPSGTYYGDVVASENAVYALIGYRGDGLIHEFRHDKGFPIWTLPDGFTAKKLAYNMGTLYALGHFGNKVSLLGMNVNSRQWYHLCDPAFAYNPSDALALNSSYGSQVIGTVGDGAYNYHFTYDAETDAVSLIDQVGTGSRGVAGACATFERKRIFAYVSANDPRTDAYAQDFEDSNRDWAWTSSIYDLDFPQDEKLLVGFDLSQDPNTPYSVRVDYMLNEDGNWHSAGSSGGQSSVYLKASGINDNKTFRQIRIRLIGDTGARVFAVAVRAYILSYQETWHLRVKLQNEKTTETPSTRRVPAYKQRDWLLQMSANKQIVEFVDGLRYPKKGDLPAPEEVIIEDPTDVIFTAPSSEGRMELTLRSVAQ